MSSKKIRDQTRKKESMESKKGEWNIQHRRNEKRMALEAKGMIVKGSAKMPRVQQACGALR